VLAERRSEEEIRRELALEREELTTALDDPRAGIDPKRRPAARPAKAAAAAVAAIVVVRLVRHHTRL